MLTHQVAYDIGMDWIEKWNEPQLSNYCSLHADDAEEISTIANQLVHVSKGRIKGKHSLNNYWELFRQLHPDYQFVLQQIIIYGNYIVVHFTIKESNTKAIAKIILNNKNKIQKTMISHV